MPKRHHARKRAGGALLRKALSLAGVSLAAGIFLDESHVSPCGTRARALAARLYDPMVVKRS